MTESKADQIHRLYRQLDTAQAQCHDATRLLNAERVRCADLRAELRAIADLDAADGPADGLAAAVRIAADALRDGGP